MEAISVTGAKRKWLYPLLPHGVLYQYRSWLSYVYLIFFFTGPYIRIQGQPLLLLNFPERKFVLLGQVFWPQDIYLFMLTSLVAMVCIIFFTLAFGRIFCGWVCPQTIFMEMVFRKMEVWIEGDAQKRKKLDASPWTWSKFGKKFTKHFLFLLVSFLIANTFLAYIIGSESLLKIISEPMGIHIVGFLCLCLFTLVFYLVYAWVREYVCTLICPYGRLQGVITDKDTLMVAYHEKRGEPRGHLVKNDSYSTLGDCVDCGLCVSVCPTGIDIRNGTQMECTNCTACIDVCDGVMEKIGKPKKLIGFFSENGLNQQSGPRFTPKMMGYSAIIFLLLGALTYFILSRKELDITILRYGGLLYQELPGGKISNLYHAEIINKSHFSQEVTLIPENPTYSIRFIQSPGKIKPGEATATVFFIIIPKNSLTDYTTRVPIRVMGNHHEFALTNTNFLGPFKN
jgi:cytochrome c oxidase accessory protein FixG